MSWKVIHFFSVFWIIFVKSCSKSCVFSLKWDWNFVRLFIFTTKVNFFFHIKNAWFSVKPKSSKNLFSNLLVKKNAFSTRQMIEGKLLLVFFFQNCYRKKKDIFVLQIPFFSCTLYSAQNESLLKSSSTHLTFFLLKK